MRRLIQTLIASVILLILSTTLTAGVGSTAFLALLDESEKNFLVSHPVVSVLYDPAWAPLEYLDIDGKPAGMSKEYLDRISDITGLTFEIDSSLDWQQGYQKLLGGDIDMTASLSSTAERRKHLVFTDPYLSAPLVIVARQDAGYIGNLHELQGRKVVVVQGYSSEEWLRTDYPTLDFISVGTVEQGLRMVQKGEAYCMVENLLVINHYSTNLGLNYEIKVVGNTPYIHALSMGVHNNVAPLSSILDKAIQSIAPEVRQEMYENNLPLQYKKAIAPATVQWLIAISVFLILILVFWIWTLVREIRGREKAETEKETSQQKFEQLFSNAPMPLALIGFEGSVIAVNKQWYSVFGFQGSSINHVSTWYDTVYPDSTYRNSIKKQWDESIEKAKSAVSSLIPPLECIITTQKGVSHTMEVSGTIFSDSILVTFFDISERKLALEEVRHLHQEAEHSRQIVLSALEDQTLLHQSLMRSSATLDAAINSMIDAVFIIDVQSHFILVNKAFLAYYRFSSRDECPPDLSSFKLLFEAYTENGKKLDTQQWSGFRALQGQSGTTEYSVYKIATAERWVGSYSFAPIYDTKQTLLGAVVVCRDITEEKAYEQKLLFQRNHDFLTGLYSRVYFEAALKNLRNKVPFTLLIVDINGLKLVNDSLGHEMGDAVLRKTAQLLSQLCSNDSVVARYGGDEFVFLLEDKTADEAERFIRNLENAAKQVAIESFHLSLSYGYATRSSLSEDVQLVMKRAEDMMNRNKLYESSSAKNKSIGLVINSLFAKSNRESAHSRRVSSLCAFLAEQLGLPEREVNRMRVAGLMHDIGKIGVEEAILNKPDSLTKEEWEVMKRHPEIGYRILSASSEFNDLSVAILEHHERWDGRGYPRGLKGEHISKQARIIMIADSYDAMTSERSYKKPLSSEEAIEEIRNCSGTHYDPAITEVFLATIHRFGAISN
ncbi:HD domain-containing phosphohydrolase [Sphaerochaeta globosa]|uniref:Diguanylate cyclase and metal dependent phosphohydrolase n=1 Tax=Sphaerochaeta globosa (strain ATCC BAA-1886 / DSM 22777 / Buddy) TaxID=158189 RepID=F0RZ62_SPHGB|nr:HD domain-containing phosphohydrolase [Sphaerochaeta globosa]ADY13343.1 diguanylate cyclase and metal dependent phosphohydrolase [Sphaerochaeta globosa str. Buddy]